MTLSVDYSVAQLMYFKVATTALSDNRLAIQTHAHEIVRKLCSEPVTQADLLWLVNFGLWRIIDARDKPMDMSLRQFDALLNVQMVWLKLLTLQTASPGILTLSQVLSLP